LSNNKHAGSRGYYQDIVPGFEYMDVMEHVLGYEGVIAHLRGQIFKYSFRIGKKDKASSESEKISWYAARLDDVIKRYEAADSSFPRQNPLIQAVITQMEEKLKVEFDLPEAKSVDPILTVRPSRAERPDEGFVARVNAPNHRRHRK
jgi:Protein of unknwon function (DUF3310)